MGQLVEQLAPAHGCSVAGIVTDQTGAAGIAADFGVVDVAVDFSLPDAVPETIAALAARRLNVVIGTTGWQAHETTLRAAAGEAGIGVLASANFSLGMNIFRLVVEEAARRYAAIGGAGAWIHEAHHAAKQDAPSGTALMLQRAMEEAGYSAGIDMSSTRAGFVPGTHTVGFDGPSETVQLTHTVRDRAVFAHGAIEAAKWLKGRRGWFTMRDMIAGA
jgi:4-hydroxy-tetrahydrodipicolinate reductase